MIVTTADSEGRIALGSRFVNATLLVEEQPGDVFIVKIIPILPEEAWLYRNPEALDRFARGLEDARRGRLTARDPASERDRTWIEDLEG